MDIFTDEETFDPHVFEMADEVEWNPWWGCSHISTGCYHCIAYGLIRRNKKDFYEPIACIKDKARPKAKKYELDYKYGAGTVFRTCTLSDFFVDKADYIRKEVWDIIKERQECLFVINTRRPERIRECLPLDWGDGLYNVLINVAIEDNYSLNRRLPQLLDAKQYNIHHLGIALSPLIEYVDIRPYLEPGIIEHVELFGERYSGEESQARPLKLSWAKEIGEHCEEYNVPFQFVSTGARPMTLKGATLNIWNRDQKALAEFYNYSKLIQDDIVFQWRINSELLDDIKRQRLIKQLQEMANNS